MPVSADALRRLSGLGLTIDQIAGVIEVMDEAEEARKVIGRERTRRHRERNATQRDVTLHDVTADYSELPPKQPETAETPRVSSTSLEVPEEPPEKENPIGGFPKSSPVPKPKARGTRLGADWTASAADLDYGRNLGIPEPTLLREAEKFRDFWIAKAGPNGVKLDWPATWRNWIRRVADDRGFAPVQSQSGSTGPPSAPEPPRPGLPTHEELLARYSRPANAAPAEPDDSPTVLRNGRSVHREIEGDGARSMPGDQAGRGRVVRLGELLPPAFTLDASGNADGDPGRHPFDDGSLPVAGMVGR